MRGIEGAAHRCRGLSGLHVLDIATLDGAYTFELERRGAQVTVLDTKQKRKRISRASRWEGLQWILIILVHRLKSDSEPSAICAETATM